MLLSKGNALVLRKERKFDVIPENNEGPFLVCEYKRPCNLTLFVNEKITYSILLLQKGTKENEFIGAQGT